MSRRCGILAAGNWIVDRIKQIDRWPEEGELCNIRDEQRSPGGGPCNVLFDLAAIDPGLPLYAAGKVGRDADGELLLAEIRRRGIDDRFLRIAPAARTGYTDVMAGQGKRTFFHCRGANAELGPEDLANIRLPVRFFYLGYLLLLDKLDLPDPEFGSAGARVLAGMREQGIETVVDFVSEAREKFERIIPAALPHIDILIINEVEAGHCLGLPLRRNDNSLDEKRLRHAAEHLLRQGVRSLAVIHFPEGAVAFSRNGEFISEPSRRLEPSRIVDATGAGDAFAAGVIYALHEDMSLREALKLGNLTACFNLLSPGASGGAISLAEMRKKG